MHASDDPVSDRSLDLDPQTSTLDTDTELFVSQLRADVARAVRRICPRWLADDADDLTQVAVSRVLARIRATAGRTAYTSGYLYRVAHSALVDEIRRRRRLREVPLEADVQSETRPDDPDRRLRAQEIRDAVARCLAALVTSRRRAVMLHLQGHSIDETSALLACARKKAENLIYRGLADLRGCLVAGGVTP